MYPRTLRVPRRSHRMALALLVAMAYAIGASAVAASPSIPPEEVTVIAVQGEVSISSQGARHAVHKGDPVPLPATVYTGPSGSVELQQGKTTLSAAPNTELTIPAPVIAGESIDRVIQSRGTAFYNVGKREVRKLHVETSYLVAVIKGTQFSVVAQEDSATISLFEGRLEVRAADYSDVVELEAGEIAIRHAGDSSIRMLVMETGEPVARNSDPGHTVGATGEGSASASAIPPNTPLLLTSTSQGAAAPAGTLGNQTRAFVATPAATLSSVATGSEAAVSAGGTTVSANAALGNGSANVSGSVTGTVAGISASASTSVSLSAASGTTSLATSAGAAVGGSNTTVGLTASASPTGVTAGAGATVSTPIASSSTGLTAGASPAGVTGTVATSVTTPIAATTVGATASVGSGTLGVAVSTPLATVNLGTGSAASPATSGTTTTTTPPTGSPGTNPTTNPGITLPGLPINPLKNLLGH